MLRTGSWQEHKEEERRSKQSYKHSDGCSSSELPKLYFPSVMYVRGQFKGCLLLSYRLCSRTNASHSGTVRNPFDFAIKERILFQKNPLIVSFGSDGSDFCLQAFALSLLTAHRLKHTCTAVIRLQS